MKLPSCPECGSYVLKLKFYGNRGLLTQLKVNCICGWSRKGFSNYNDIRETLSMEKDIKMKPIFELAKSVSRHSSMRVKVGAVLTKNGKPQSVGFNIEKSHPIYSNPISGNIHAESRALSTSGFRYLDNSVMYIYRETKDGKPALARPCDDCLMKLKEFGVKKIFYTVSPDKDYSFHYERL